MLKKLIFHYVKALLSCCTKYVAQSNGKEGLHRKLRLNNEISSYKSKRMTVLKDPEYAYAVCTCKAVTAEGWWHGATDATLPGLVEDLISCHQSIETEFQLLIISALRIDFKLFMSFQGFYKKVLSLDIKIRMFSCILTEFYKQNTRANPQLEQVVH